MYDFRKVITVAKNELGYLEKKSNSQLDEKEKNAGYNNWTKYARDLDRHPDIYNGNKNGYAWCDVFVDWCFMTAYGKEAMFYLLCQPKDSYGAGCGYSAKYFRKKGQFFKDNPQVGDQIFFGTPGNESHTGIVVEVKNGKVYTIEGNTSSAQGVVPNGGGVFKKSYNLSFKNISGYGRPAWNGKINIDETPLLSYGCKGDKVKEIQNLLIKNNYVLPKYGADGDFGQETLNAIKKFQKDNSLEIDGIVDDEVWNLLKEGKKVEYSFINFVKDIQQALGVSVDGIPGLETLSKTITISAHKNYKHQIVLYLQKYLYSIGYTEIGTADGVAGTLFTQAVKHFQKDNGCVVDGEITAKNTTWKKLLKL